MPNKRKLTLSAVCILIIGSIIGTGAYRTPTPPAAGTALQGTVASAPATAPTTIRVASFNIHSGQGEHTGENLDLTAKTLEGFDFAGLMEVRGALAGPDQAQRLGEKLGESYLFLPAERQFWHEAFGNAVLSRMPVTHWERRPLTSPTGGSRRNVTIVRLANGMTILVTHIARNADQPRQLEELSKLFLEQPMPVILIGDLNVTSADPTISKLLQQPDVRSPLDLKMPDQAGKHIDWILARGMDVVAAGTKDLSASDHPLVWAELRTAEPATQP